MRKILSAIAVAAFASAAPLLVAGTGARAEEAHNAAEPTHFPIHKPKQEDWSFYGPDRRATLEFPSPLLRNQPTRLVLEDGEPGGVASRRSERIVSYEEAFKRELEEFAAAIRDEREPRTGGEDGLRDVALCRSIVQAHASGGPIEWPSRPGTHAA